MLLLGIILKKQKSNRFISGWYPCELLKRENGRNTDGFQWKKKKSGKSESQNRLCINKR